jgi:hypothetical protein
LHCDQQFLGASNYDVPQQDGPLWRLARVIHLYPVCGSVDQVYHVIEPRSQQVDVFPVERGDEHAIQPGHDLVGDLVGLMLQSLDCINDRPAPGRVSPEKVQL